MIDRDRSRAPGRDARPARRREAQEPRWRRVFKDKFVLGVVSVMLLVVGCVGIFVEASDMGSTAAIVAGAVMLAMSALVDRVLMIKYGQYEVYLAREYLEAAEIAEEEGDEPAAEALRDQGLDVLRQAKESRITYSVALRRLYTMAREHVEAAVRSALEAEGLELEPRGLESLLTYFSLIGAQGGAKVGVIVSFREWDYDADLPRLRASVHATPGLKGIVVVQNMLTPRRRSSGLPQPSSEDIQRIAENDLGGSIKIRIASWRQGDPIDVIRHAIREVLF